VRGGDGDVVVVLVVVVLAATAQSTQSTEAVSMIARGIESGNVTDRRLDRSFIVVVIITFV